MDCRWIMETTIPVLLLKEDALGWIVEACNTSFLNLVNLEPASISGKSLEHIVDKYDDLSWMKRYNDTKLALIDIGGAWFEIEILRNDNRIAYIHHDLTAQVESDNTNKRLQIRLNQIQRIAQIGDWEHDYRTGDEFWSDEIYRIMGFKDKTVQPNIDTFMRFVHPDDLEKIEKAHRGVSSGQGYDVEYRIITIEGHTKWIVTRAKVDLDEDGKSVRVYGTMQDITERKKLEKRVEQAFTVAEDAYQSRGQFLAMISHEVRTPINGIMGMSQLLKNSILDDEQSEFVEDIMFSADALLNIIEDILEMSKMESNLLKADSEEFDLHVLMRNIVRMYQLKKVEKPVRFVHRIDPKIPQFVWGDSTKIQQILINILGNAFKFTDEGRVSLTVRVLEDDINQSKIAFEIDDTGIGISEDQQKEIFAKFNQGDPDIQKKYGGYGLGLSISKNFAELMNGYLFVESELGRGTKFTFALTLEKSKTLEMDKSADSLYSRMKSMHVRVLVVEENDQNKDYFSTMLVKRYGFKVDFASDLNAVLQALDHFSYQFIVLDADLENNSGVYMTRMIRESLKVDGLALPIIALAGNSSLGNRESLMAAGVSYFIEKPVNESTFMGVIHQILDINAVRKRAKTKIGYRYIKSEKLGKKRIEVGREVFESKLLGTVQSSHDKVSKILAASAPLNILVLSHEIDEIDDVITSFGTDDICESLELIKSALLNDDTAGIEVIVTDFMEEYQCFVDELQEFIHDSGALPKKY